MLDSCLPFLPKRMKVKKCNKFVYNLYDKETCDVLKKKGLKQVLNRYFCEKYIEHNILKY